MQNIMNVNFFQHKHLTIADYCYMMASMGSDFVNKIKRLCRNIVDFWRKKVDDSIKVVLYVGIIAIMFRISREIPFSINNLQSLLANLSVYLVIGVSAKLGGRIIDRMVRNIISSKKKQEIQPQLEVNSPKINLDRTRTKDIYKEDYKTIDSSNDRTRFQEILEKNYRLYEKQPDAFDLTLEPLNQDQLATMMSLVTDLRIEYPENEVFRNLEPKVKTALDRVRSK